ncbi:SIMPL domain-containing protein [Nocardioides speluncae]|uniref:SIMPL domain-containing protein n=1 Tax=Nocardioides speluncae TaxID=2670337 RepID=UPI000D699DA2|nr:SIMPL domain-containing protein [Nocardioides speluncae]
MERTVTVTGQGESRAVPDAASIRISLHHRAAGVADAVTGADSAARQAVATARTFTTPQRVASSGLQVWPAHDHEGRQNGFEARHELSIRCDDVTVAGKLVGALAAEVGDRLQIDSFSLDVSDPAAAKTAAREAAYADARVKAEHLARLGDAILLEVLAIAEGGSSGPGPIYAMEAAMGGKRDMSFEPGETAIGATVTVTWRIE